jgi:CheY-like chemotaxis protein
MTSIIRFLDGWRVLVVDDEPDNVDVVRRILIKFGAQVQTAENGQQALDLLQKEAFEFVICDLTMPDIDGWELLRRVRAIPQLEKLPMIVLTAHAMAGDRERAKEAGFLEYMTKPIDVDVVGARLLVAMLSVPHLSQRINKNPAKR